MRYDLQVVASWIKPGSKVLDLGCGTGSLLEVLVKNHNVIGTGIEQDEVKVEKGILRGLTVLHGDIYEEIMDYPDDCFDYVILSQTLQQVYEPSRLIKQMLRVGRQGVVSFPNFSHWKNRVHLLMTGKAPVTKELPFQWHDSPNIRVITLKDFQRFCKENSFRIVEKEAIRTHHHDEQGKTVRIMPNLLATYGIFMLGKG